MKLEHIQNELKNYVGDFVRTEAKEATVLWMHEKGLPAAREVSAAYTAALSAGAFKALNVLFWWYPQLRVILMPHYDNAEKDIRLCMALFFSIIALMLYLNLEIAFGAFEDTS